MDSEVKDKIEQTVGTDRVVLFMKGTRMAPQCGFSAKVVSILDEFLPEYTTVNVLEDPDVRQGVKEFSNWPTIPQLYIEGEFIGGCDIVTEMFATGDLEEKLGVKAEEIEPPEIEVTDAAVQALKGALQSDDDFIRLDIDARFDNDLSVGPSNPSDVRVESNGITVVMSRSTARRASGVRIDFVKTPQGPAFKIENPNEPARVRPMTVQELKAKLDGAEPIELFDVRSPDERELARIEGARAFDEEAQKHIAGLDKTTVLVFVCHVGGRSQAAAEHFIAQGFQTVYNVIGGIDAWSQEIDPSVPRY